MTTKIVRKIKMTDKERKVIKDLVNFIEESFNINTEDEPELVAEIVNGIFCGQVSIYTSFGYILAEYEETGI